MVKTIILLFDKISRTDGYSNYSVLHSIINTLLIMELRKAVLTVLLGGSQGKLNNSKS